MKQSVFFGALFALVLFISGCGKTSDVGLGGMRPPPPPPPPPPIVAPTTSAAPEAPPSK